MNNTGYMIITDMDGTLISSKGDITPFTLQYLKGLNKKGNTVVLASGRPLRSIVPFYNQLELTGPLIAYNGAMIYNPKENDVIYCKQVKKEWAKSFWKTFKDKALINYFAEGKNKLYIHHFDESFDQYFNFQNYEVVQGELDEILDEDIFDFIVDIKDFSYKAEMTKFARQFDTNDIRYWSDHLNIGEFFFSDSDKKHALKYIFDYYKQDLNKTIAFGDSGNDITMLKMVKYGFLMSNAVNEMKALCPNLSLEDNNHDGIALTLQKLFDN